MQLAVDLIFLVILVVAVIASAKKGIVRTVLEIAAFVLSVVLAAQLAAPMANTCYDSFLSEQVEKKIYTELSESDEQLSGAKTVLVTIDSLPDFIQKSFDQSDGSFNTAIQQITENGASNAEIAKQLNEQIARPLGVMVLTSILFLLIFVLANILLQWLAKILSKAFKLPIVRTVNGALGGVFGAVKGCLLIFLACVVLIVLAPYIGGAFQEAVDSSVIVGFVENHLIADYLANAI